MNIFYVDMDNNRDGTQALTAPVSMVLISEVDG